MSPVDNPASLVEESSDEFEVRWTSYGGEIFSDVEKVD